MSPRKTRAAARAHIIHVNDENSVEKAGSTASKELAISSPLGEVTGNSSAQDAHGEDDGGKEMVQSKDKSKSKSLKRCIDGLKDDEVAQEVGGLGAAEEEEVVIEAVVQPEKEEKDKTDDLVFGNEAHTLEALEDTEMLQVNDARNESEAGPEHLPTASNVAEVDGIFVAVETKESNERDPSFTNIATTVESQFDNPSSPPADTNIDSLLDSVPVLEPPTSSSEQTLPVTPAHQTLADASEAIQKLEALFQPESTNKGEDREESTIADILARTPAAKSPLNHRFNGSVGPIDATTASGAVVDNQFQPTAEKHETDTISAPTNSANTTGGAPVNAIHVAAGEVVKLAPAPKAIGITRKSSVMAVAKSSSHDLVVKPTVVNGAKSKQRSSIAALHTPPRLTKSNKPLTTSSFQLPGEAIAAKLKAQREERLKNEADEAQKKREFKAKPILKLVRPAEVKMTAASRARTSLVAGTSLGQDGPNEISRRSSLAQPRVSSMAFRPRSSMMSSQVRVKRVSSHLAAPSRPTSQLQKGREVYNRSKVEKEDKDKVLREKQEAAKKARDEASERGRAASREWAEKKKKAKGVSGGGSRVVCGASSGVNQTTVVHRTLLLDQA